MKKFWRVFWYEYRRHVFRRRFLFALFSAPAFIVLMILLSWLAMRMEVNTTPIGYLDRSGLLANPVPPPVPEPPGEPVPMMPFESEEAAQAALQAGKIQAYYIVPEDYLDTGRVSLFYLEEPKGPAKEQFSDFLAANLLAGQPQEIANRILQGSKMTVTSIDSKQSISEDRWLSLLMPFFIGIIFVVAIAASSGYLLHAVVEEKENRTMEIVITSVSPLQLMGGKIIGDIAIGLTQLFVWGIFVFAGIMVGQNYFEWLRGIEIPSRLLVLGAALMFPALVLNAALMAAIGSTVTEGREAQQIAGWFVLPLWLPYMFTVLFVQNPNSPLVVGMSLFPLTAPMAMVLRAGFTTVPAWQIGLSILGVNLTALGGIWLAGRAFRLGMLRYGQRLRLQELFALRRIAP